MTEKVPCTKCGALVLPSTAERTGGVCMACKNGTRESMEKSKEYYKKERELDKTCPFRLFWKELVSRVYNESKGFNSLSEEEKIYFSVNCLSGEVYNGGFDQYFSNSAGENYKHAELGLIQLEATNSLRLLRKAKQIVFGSSAVPKEQYLRQLATDSDEVSTALDELDTEFYKDPDRLAEKLEVYAINNGLVKNA
jgi:hypothetical protein